MITREQVAEVLREFEGSEVRNPVKMKEDPAGVMWGGCLYNGPDNTHCIAGAVFERFETLDLVMENCPVSALRGVHDRYTDGAIELLGLAQRLADAGSQFGEPKPWGDVITILQDWGQL